MVATKTLIDELLPFEEVRFRRPTKLDDSIKTRDNRCDAYANYILAV